MIETWMLKTTFMVFWLSTWPIRMPFEREQKKNTITVNQKTTEEKVLLGSAFLGMVLIPVVYVFTTPVRFCPLSISLSLSNNRHCPDSVVSVAFLSFAQGSEQKLVAFPGNS